MLPFNAEPPWSHLMMPPEVAIKETPFGFLAVEIGGWQGSTDVVL
jgi:hypothetical protein